jgi:hypothetical protein
MEVLKTDFAPARGKKALEAAVTKALAQQQIE